MIRKLYAGVTIVKDPLYRKGKSCEVTMIPGVVKCFTTLQYNFAGTGDFHDGTVWDDSDITVSTYKIVDTYPYGHDGKLDTFISMRKDRSGHTRPLKLSTTLNVPDGDDDDDPLVQFHSLINMVEYVKNPLTILYDPWFIYSPKNIADLDMRITNYDHYPTYVDALYRDWWCSRRILRLVNPIQHFDHVKENYFGGTEVPVGTIRFDKTTSNTPYMIGIPRLFVVNAEVGDMYQVLANGYDIIPLSYELLKGSIYCKWCNDYFDPPLLVRIPVISRGKKYYTYGYNNERICEKCLRRHDVPASRISRDADRCIELMKIATELIPPELNGPAKFKTIENGLYMLTNGTFVCDARRFDLVRVKVHEKITAQSMIGIVDILPVFYFEDYQISDGTPDPDVS